MRVNLLSIDKIAQRLQNENDRSVAIIAASVLELQLEELLSKAMIEHQSVAEFFKGYGPLSSLSAKASLALFLGLIPSDVFNDLTYVRKIRNEFAHKHEDIDFSQPPVSDFVSHLVSEKWLLHCMPLADKPIKPEEADEIRTKPRRAFEIAASIVSWQLDIYIESIQRPRPAASAFQFPPLR
jgi:DNA-binding MltR family transcriptional regulator